MRLLLILCCLCPLSAVDADLDHAQVLELLQRLPELPEPRPQPSEQLAGDVNMLEGMVAITPGQRVVLHGISQFDQGPTDGLEVLACLEGGKNHESFARLLTGNAELTKAAFIAGLGLDQEGQPAPEMGAIPARGIPLAVDVVWQPDPLLKPDDWVRAPASCLVRDRLTDRPWPALPFVYTGSRFLVTNQTVPGMDGVQKIERFMLGVTLSLAVNFDEPDALLASPFPTAAQDNLFEVNSKISPPVGSKVSFVFTRAVLPVELELNPQGALSKDGVRLDDAALGELLAAQFGVEVDPEPALRAIAIRAPFTGAYAVSDDRVVETRARILRLAGEHAAWVVPLFTP